MKTTLAQRYGFICAGLAVFTGLVVLVVSLIFLSYFADESVEYTRKQVKFIVDKRIVEVAERMASSMSNNLSDAVYDMDFSSIEEQLKPLKAYENFIYAYVDDNQGRIIHDGSADISRYGEPIARYLPPELDLTVSKESKRIGNQLHLAQPVVIGEQQVAIFRMAFDYTQSQQDIALLLDNTAQKILELRTSITKTILLTLVVLLVLCSLVVMFLSRRMLSPVDSLATSCRRYAEGDRDVVFALDRSDELGELSNALEEMKFAISQSHTEIEKLAYLDSLTNLPNRRMFMQELTSLLAWAERHESHLAVVFIDLDNFKQINDTAGHEVGDRLLQLVAERLSEFLRAQDIIKEFPVPESFLLSRLGGDEFVLMLPYSGGDQVIIELVERINMVLDAPYAIAGNHYHVSCSIGVTFYPQNGITPSVLLKQADMAMYAAKEAGRCGYQLYTDSMDIAINHEVQVLREIRDAIINGDLYLDYQPVFSFENNQMIGAEALVRWRHADQGRIAPDDFIPLIEKTDFIEPLTLWVVERACRDLKQHLLPRDRDFKMFVNISGVVLTLDSVHKQVKEIIAGFHLPARRLCLEVTETGMIENIEIAGSTLNSWKGVGANIWVDDFGTGYSSLSYLHSLPIDGLKIDQSFISDLNVSGVNPVLSTILTLAESLGINTIAEGIETEAQYECLKRLQSTYGQGNFFQTPQSLGYLLERFEVEF